MVSTLYIVLYSKYILVATSRSQKSLAIPLRPSLLRALLHYSIVPFLLMKHSPLTFKWNQLGRKVCWQGDLSFLVSSLLPFSWKNKKIVLKVWYSIFMFSAKNRNYPFMFILLHYLVTKNQGEIPNFSVFIFVLIAIQI